MAEVSRTEEYLYFLADPDGVRKKKVLPTEKLLAEGDEFMEMADQEEQICNVLGQKGKDQLWNPEQKLMTQFPGMEHGENNEKNRQEVYLP